MTRIPENGTVIPVEFGEFDQEFYLSRSEIATFLRELANLLESGGLVEMNSSNWRIGITPNEPIMLDIDYDGDPKEKKLKIQLKLREIPGILRPTVGPGR
jgi:amphi-Trp domain-containing protein